MAAEGLSRAGVRNLQAMPLLVALLCFVYWTIGFSGPYRWLIDLQMMIAGMYTEFVAIPLLFIALLGTATAMTKWIGRVAGGISYGRAELLVMLVLVGLTAFAILNAWNVGSRYLKAPGFGDPVVVVDLARVDRAQLRSAHVRVLGRVDTARRTGIWRYGRGRRLRAELETYVPVVASRGALASAPPAIVADFDPPGEIEGLLLAGGLDTRTRYRLRVAGLPVDADTFLLSQRTKTLEGEIIGAAIMAGLALLVWAMILHAWLSGTYARERREIASGPR